jgi:hypothetical protein
MKKNIPCKIKKTNWEYIQKKYKWSASVFNPCNPDDVSGMLSLIDSYYKDVDESHKDYLYWEYIDNPSGRAFIYLAKHENKVVGQYVANPMIAYVGGILCRGCVITKTLTRSDFRNKGIYGCLFEKTIYACRQKGVDFFYGFPNKLVYRTVIEKQGFRSIAKIPLLVKPLKIKKISRVVIKNKMLAGALGIVLSLIYIVFNVLSKSFFGVFQPKKYNLVIQEHKTFDTRFDIFWNKVKSSYKNIMNRDSMFLNWRYVSNPRRSYKIISASGAKGNILAYIVLRTSMLNLLKVGYVVDILSERTNQGFYASFLLIERACDYFRQQSVDSIGCIMLPDKPYFSIFLKNGFFVCPSKFEPQPCMLVAKNIKHDFDSHALYEWRNWFVTFGDYDVV